jgi:hypothetical protein
MKFPMKGMPMEDDMDEMEDEAPPPKKGSGKKALQAALMERMMGKKKHGPRCQCAKCTAKK